MFIMAIILMTIEDGKGVREFKGAKVTRYELKLKGLSWQRLMRNRHKVV